MLEQPDLGVGSPDHAAAKSGTPARSAVARKLRAVALEARALADHQVPIGFGNVT
jgi:hypothetical protein